MPARPHLHRPLLALAGLAGATGVALAARATHEADANLSIAANFLLLHAPALLALGLLPAGRLALGAGYVLGAGLVLFAGDLVCRSALGHALFPLAAPLGGGGLVLGWLLLVAAALFGGRRATSVTRSD